MTPPAADTKIDKMLEKLANPARVEHTAVLSTAVGALTLIDPARLGTGGRLSLRLATAALTGFSVWATARASHPHVLFAPVRWGVTAAAAGAAMACAEVAEALDAHAQSAFSRWGVRHPRVVLAVTGMALIAAVSRAPSKPTEQAAKTSGEHEDTDFTVDLPDEVRPLVSALLSATDECGAPALRQQLAAARAVLYSGEDENAFYPGIGFEVLPDLPLAVPGEARFFVIGRYYPFNGHSADVYVSVSEGRLANLTIAPGADWSTEDEIAWMEAGGSMQDVRRWPRPDELILLGETAQGLQPI